MVLSLLCILFEALIHEYMVGIEILRQSFMFCYEVFVFFYNVHVLLQQFVEVLLGFIELFASVSLHLLEAGYDLAFLICPYPLLLVQDILWLYQFELALVRLSWQILKLALTIP
jgi:hypothetical protein